MKSFDNIPNRLSCHLFNVAEAWTFVNEADAIQNDDIVSYPARNVLWIDHGDVITANDQRPKEE